MGKYWDNNCLNEYCTEQIKECTTLERLFEIWKEAHKQEPNFDAKNSNIKQANFVKDGFIDGTKYCKENGILFILKESHIDKVIENDDQVKFYKGFLDESNFEIKENIIIPTKLVEEIKKLKAFDNIPKQKEKIARMAKYIFDETVTSDYNELKNALEKVAFMNINKRGGAVTCDEKQLKEYYEKYRKFIIREIEIIEPKTIVIMTNKSKIEDELKKTFPKIRFISMVHPAARGRALNIKTDEEKIEAYRLLGEEQYNLDKADRFNNTDGPFVKFNKSTFKYLIKFIAKYNT